MNHRAQKPIQYVAQVAPVKEVTLHGTADRAFWRERLRPENLELLPQNDRAQVFVSATETRFMGILFREGIVGIHVQPHRQNGEEVPAMYLLHAWNSLRAFAWIERNLFGTPYFPGQITVDPQFPVRFQIAERKAPLINAAMTASPHPPTNTADENWFGAIFLPRRNRRHQQFFFAKLEGKTDHYRFNAAADEFTVARTANCPTIDLLTASHFTPHAWHVRQAAAHAKSKTYRAADFFTPCE